MIPSESPMYQDTLFFEKIYKNYGVKAPNTRRKNAHGV